MNTKSDACAELERLSHDLANAAARLSHLALAIASVEASAPVQPAGGATPEDYARLYTVPEVMERLAVGRATAYELIRTGELRSLKIGRSRRVSHQALIEYLASR
jgi:excisionase family DNA binding protein